MNEPAKARIPSQIPFIIANEGCERFSFYGMRNILVQFLTTSLLLSIMPDKAARELHAKDLFHLFVVGVYFFPLLGGYLADRFFGKYNTILWFSLIYCVGQGLLALFVDEPNGFYTGMFLIALGSGGIKPLVASFMGDQFDSRTKHLAKLTFDAFYWIINFGSLFASLLMPMFLTELGPRVAFGIPGILMFIATVVFWAGHRRYVMVKPPPQNPHSFMKVARTALFARVPGKSNPGLTVAVIGVVVALASLSLAPYLKFHELYLIPCIMLVVLLGFGGLGTSLQLERARGKHPDEAVDGVRAVLRILIVFALVTPFWSLFDQKASTWVLQANDMTKPSWFSSSQMQALNPALVMVIIPFNNLVLWPYLRKRGREPSQLNKMNLGIALSAIAWVVVGVMQLVIDSGTRFSITWQILPYVFLTAGEVLVSATGLEFAYSQAPLAMKGAIMSFWNLAVTIGNIWVLLVNHSIKGEAITSHIKDTGISVTAFLMFFFAAFAFAAAIAFRSYAKRYRMIDNYRG
ncbi:MAG TPA: oligopeptide:H+ symporter [Kofleriaceae bacterium]